jgi:hypothetical protein
MRSARQVILGLGACAVLLVVTSALVSMRYAAYKLDHLRGQQGCSSAEEAMRQMLLREMPRGRVRIVGVGKDGPGLRYVVAGAWPAATDPRSRTASGGYRETGRFFLRMEQGWVYLPEGDVTGPVVAVGKALIDLMSSSQTYSPPIHEQR